MLPAPLSPHPQPALELEEWEVEKEWKMGRTGVSVGVWWVWTHTQMVTWFQTANPWSPIGQILTPHTQSCQSPGLYRGRDEQHVNLVAGLLNRQPSAFCSSCSELWKFAMCGCFADHRVGQTRAVIICCITNKPQSSTVLFSNLVSKMFEKNKTNDGPALTAFSIWFILHSKGSPESPVHYELIRHSISCRHKSTYSVGRCSSE